MRVRVYTRKSMHIMLECVQKARNGTGESLKRKPATRPDQTRHDKTEDRTRRDPTIDQTRPDTIRLKTELDTKRLKIGPDKTRL